MDRTRDFLRGRRRSELTAEEMAVLEAAISEVVVVPPRRIIAHRADRLHNSTLLIEGFICRYMDARDGYRQLVSYQVPGDFVDLHGFVLAGLEHDVVSMGRSEVEFVGHDEL
ncbi:MAG: Crp/Fnr family transcriptional regulator, partial [Proteobacteria bacterium]|nr:Crp/Fnr family transcriptional regulator [Pseudomonadota bacterium]